MDILSCVMRQPSESSLRIVSSSSSVIFQVPKQSVSLPDFFVMRRIVSVKLSLAFFSRSKASYAFCVIEIVLVAIIYACVRVHR